MSIERDGIHRLLLSWHNRKERASGSRAKAHSFGAATEPSIASFTRRALLLQNLHHYIENHRQQIVYLFIFFSICILLFAERFYSTSATIMVRGGVFKINN